MPYRLPLELELCILELAAPPLVKPRLIDRVAFFINISLVHRSFTAWAQERLHDQFLYTFRPRKDEYARLEQRLTEAGFGPSRSIPRLYLDVTRLRSRTDLEPYELSFWTEETAEQASAVNESFKLSEAQSEPTYSGHGVFETTGEWTLSPLLAHCVQALDTLWLMPPYTYLDVSDNPAPRLLWMDDEAFRVLWNDLHALPLSQQTTLVLRKTTLALSLSGSRYPVLNLILDQSTMYPTPNLLFCFPNLEVLVACDSSVADSLPRLDWLPGSVRHVHILQSNFEDLQEEPAPTATFPALESLTFTWLQPDAGESGNPAADVANPLLDLRKFVESSFVAPQCTFKYLRSTKSSEEALADAMADLGVGS